ncbi:MAG: Wzz/FepE/Etk N-terminal domain-containing protein [Halomonas sp.]|nr:Wzz/FepE/Etk N-terminal domain-containing protein [Halomonas sp.]
MTPQDSASSRQYDDEITLVDLVMILVKRWKAMAVIFSLVVLAALAYVLLVPRVYSYSSIYNVAEQGPGQPLESPQALVAKVRNLYVGPVTRELLAETGLEALPFDVGIENPAETLLITLVSEAKETNQELVATLHKGILERLQAAQEEFEEDRTESLERQLESARETLEAARQSNSLSAAEVVASIMGRIAGLEASLEELRQGEVGQVAIQSLEPTGTSRTLVLVLASVLGGVLAILGAFFMQFASLVNKSMTKADS